MVPPNAFVPMAEEHDLINALTESVFEQAVRQGGEWRRMGLDIKIAVKISMQNVDQIDFPEYVVTHAEMAGLKAENVILDRNYPGTPHLTARG